MRTSFNGGKPLHRIAGELIAVARSAAGPPGAAAMTSCACSVRFDRVLGTVGELRRDARHHPDEPQPGGIADRNGTSVSCSSAGTCGRARQTWRSAVRMTPSG